MTKKFDNNLHGALWHNFSENESAPQWTGQCEINNQKFRIAMWATGADKTEKTPTYTLRFEEAKQ